MARPSPVLSCITLVQVICSISIIAITSNRMTHPGFGTDKRCYLSSDPYNTSPCSLAYAAAGISLAIAALAGCLRCCSLDCCGLGPIQSIILAAFNCIWWLVVSAILTAAAAAADAAGLPAADGRHMILVAAWCAVAAELVHSVTACLVVGNNVCNILFCVDAIPGGEDCCGGDCCGGRCCSCCGGGRRRHNHRRSPAGHVEPLLPSAGVAAAAAAATGLWLNKAWWQRSQPGVVHQQQQRPVTVVTIQQGGPTPVAGGYMPPPPTAGQPYVVAPGQPAAAWTPSMGVPAAGAPQGPPGAAAGSFGGFPATGVAPGAGTPALDYALAQGGGGQPSAPAAPQQPYAPPVVMQQMDAAGGDLYPSIPKQ